MSRSDDLDDIAAVIYRYSTAMDTNNWSLMDAVFTADATVDMGGYLFPKGRKQIVDTIKAAIDCCSQTHHMNTNIEVQLEGDRARVTNRFLAWHRGRAPNEHLTYLAMGTYTDDFIRTADGWRIHHRMERNPIEAWDDSRVQGSQQTFFANAMAAFAAVAKPG